jgi:glutathionylspermidine synthase
MERRSVAPRRGWQQKVESQGLIFHTVADQPYWDESVYYQFNAAQIDRLEAATNELQARCLDAVQFVIDRNRFADLGIPPAAVPAIRAAWEEEPPAIYGRMDFSWDGNRAPKLLEYNADTPTALLEAAVIQWYWLQDAFPQADQFNSLHERLIAKWKELSAYLRGPLYFAHTADNEDGMTATYLRDTASQAGLLTSGLFMKEIGWQERQQRFVDLQGEPIRSIFKLYPWEWMVHEEFGRHALATAGQVQWIEPIWKLVLSSKGILAILWEMFPGHPNLLEAYLDGPRQMQQYVRKPKFSREGANLLLVDGHRKLETAGDYGEEGYVWQGPAPLPDFHGNRPVIGSWIIDGQSAGMGIRESDGPVTDNFSRFVPHLFLK